MRGGHFLRGYHEMRRFLSFVMIGFSVLVGGCETTGTGQSGGGVNKQAIGTFIGGLAGALVGSQVGGGRGQLVAIAIGGLAGAAIGNQIGKSLDAADRAAVERKSAEALSSARDGQTVAWNNPDSGASATITPQNTRREDRKIAVIRQKQVAPMPRLELIGDTWEAAKSANVRAAPTTESAVLSSLKQGEAFTAVGKVEGSDWIVVAKGNRTIGYVASSLVRKASVMAEAKALRPAVNLDALEKDRAVDLDASNLIAEEVVVSSACRDMNVAVSTKNGATEQQNLKACKGSDGAWEII